MHPAFSVIFLTTLIGAGQGLFLALYTGQIYSVFNVFPEQDSHNFYGIGSLIAVLFLVTGLIASMFHLGHPERAWRSAAMWRTSWLSREVIALPAFISMTIAYGSIHYFDLNPILFNIGDSLIIDLSLLIGAINTLLAFTLFICTGMIYACIKFLQEWATSLTLFNFILLGTASGFIFATAFAQWNNSELVTFYAIWSIIITVSAFISRLASLIRNTKLKYKSNMRTAIGIRHNKIQQKSQGSMGGSFNTREYFHGVTPGMFKSMKWMFLILVFPVPIILIFTGLTSNSLFLFTVAFSVQYIGLIMERWFFFAQANHPQNLYYQTV